MILAIVLPQLGQMHDARTPRLTTTLSELRRGGFSRVFRLKGEVIRVGDGRYIVTIMSPYPTAEIGLAPDDVNPALICELTRFYERYEQAAAYLRRYSAKHPDRRIVVQGVVDSWDAETLRLTNCSFI